MAADEPTLLDLFQRPRVRVLRGVVVDGARPERGLELPAVLVESKGMEGELPFPYYGKSEMLFADLRTQGRAFATLDYSDEPPLLFVGEWIEFEELKLKNLRQFEGWA